MSAKNTGRPAWNCGVARIDITPSTPQWMDGSGHRTHPSTGVYHPLYGYALYVSDGSAEAVVLNFDLLDIDPDSVRRVRRRLRSVLGLPAEAVVFNATHNHDGPCVSRSLLLQGTIDDAYVAEFEDKLVEAAQRARESAQPCTLGFSRTRAVVGVNRRQIDWASGTCRGMGPNPEGAHDKAVDTLWVRKPDGTLLASMTSHGCHATVCKQMEMGGDWPGFFRQAMERRSGAPALWLQGCAGNVRPWFTNRLDGFGGNTIEDGRAMGRTHAGTVWKSRTREHPLEPGALRASRRTIRLPLQTPVDFDAFAACFGGLVDRIGRERVHASWAAAVTQSHAPFEIQALTLASRYHLVFWAGEMCTDIGIALRDFYPGHIVTPHGYSNGTIGYVPARHMVPQGGYEVDRSFALYQKAAPFQEDVEDRILTATIRMLDAHIAE